MNDQAEQAKSIFLEAIERHAPGCWPAFLDRACAGDKMLRASVERLLRAQAVMGAFHEKPPARGRELVGEGPGTVIGPYKLMEQIGEGGMGLVFVAAQQEPMRRKVALKVVKPGMDTREVIARFEAERQVLALMDHPGIARVLDAGATASGRPYFVMELVKGIPITEYCDKHQLRPQQRLELFVSVCQAVQHAHQKGIIHRDLKPSNILVSSHDGTPVVKVIDFGVAKALGQQLTEKTIYTGFVQMLGTPLYMSPEQAEMSGLDIDTRTDIYALGVMLYELLTGTTPFAEARFRQASFDEIRRIIREEEPPKPSTRVSTLAQAVDTVSANRQCDPRKLGRLMRRELDWIVMRCLEKDRNRRYETASALASDVQRYLRDEPVLAGPPGAGYRIRKFVRRHRKTVLSAALMLSALLAGLAGATWGLVRAERARADADTARLAEFEAREREAKRAEGEALQRKRAEANEQRANSERDRAEEEARIAEAVKKFLQTDLLRQADPRTQAETLRLAGGAFETQENPTVKELLDRAAAELTPDKIEAKFPKQPRLQAEILHTIGFTYLGVGEYRKAIDHLARARDGMSATLGPEDRKTLATLRHLGEAYRRAGKNVAAMAVLEKLHQTAAATLGPEDPDTLATLEQLAAAIGTAGKTTRAIALLEQARDARLKQLGRTNPQTLATLSNLAAAYRLAGRTDEAIALFEEVRVACETTLGLDHPNTLATLHQLAVAYSAAKKHDQAVRLYEDALRQRKVKLGLDHPDTLATTASLGLIYRDMGKQAEGLALMEEALELAKKRSGPLPAQLRWVPYALAETYDRALKFASSEPFYRKFVGMARMKFGEGRPQVASAMIQLALNLLRQGKGAEAEPVLLECLAIREANAPRAWKAFEAKALLGAAFLEQRKYVEAEPLLRAGYLGLKERAARIPKAHQARLGEALDRLIELASVQADQEAAKKWMQERTALRR